MWHLDYLDDSKEREYLGLIINRVKDKRRIVAINMASVGSYLTDEKLKELLISKLDKLYSESMIEECKISIFNGEYENWLSAKLKKTHKRTEIERNLIKKYKNVIEMFDYNNFISCDKDTSYEMAKLIGVNTCVYCNRQYIFTVGNEEEKITRPEFDHYLPKSRYPFFALSLYNLIPSCHICNSSCKGSEELEREMNPYLTDEKKDYFKFTYHIEEDWLLSSVQITNIDSQKEKDVKKLLECFRIQEIYNCHTNFELKDLYTFATKYTNTYLQEVLSGISLNLKLSQEEAYRILFGTELFKEKDNDRPLSKFKRDILEELGVISPRIKF